MNRLLAAAAPRPGFGAVFVPQRGGAHVSVTISTVYAFQPELGDERHMGKKGGHLFITVLR